MNASALTDRSSTRSGSCGYNTNRVSSKAKEAFIDWNEIDSGRIIWRDHCAFIDTLSVVAFVDVKNNMTTTKECSHLCINNSAFTHFIHLNDFSFSFRVFTRVDETS